MSRKVFKPTPKHRLIDHNPLPDLATLDSLNPQLPFLKQNPNFGWNAACTPTRAGRKVNDFVDGQRKLSLVQHIAHARMWVQQQISDMITCYLPTFIRKIKLSVKVIQLGRKLRQLVATYNFWRTVIEKEIAFANHYINQSNAVIGYAKSNLSPAALRAEWENEVAEILDQAIADNLRQITENDQSKCLI